LFYIEFNLIGWNSESMVINLGINNPGRNELETELVPEGMEIKILAWNTTKYQLIDNVGWILKIPVELGWNSESLWN